MVCHAMQKWTLELKDPPASFYISFLETIRVPVSCNTWMFGAFWAEYLNVAKVELIETLLLVLFFFIILYFQFQIIGDTFQFYSMLWPLVFWKVECLPVSYASRQTATAVPIEDYSEFH